MRPLSELAWKLPDYEDSGVEIPERIKANPNLCEGQMMTDEEIDEFIADSIGVLKVLRDGSSVRFSEIHGTFLADLQCLWALGRLNDEDYNELCNLEL